MSKLRLMSDNIWWTGNNSKHWEALGEDCSPQHRAPGFAKIFNETLPDVIGLQESAAVLTDNVTQVLNNNCEITYALLWGRDTPIIYRTDRLELIDVDFKIYPEYTFKLLTTSLFGLILYYN